MSITDHFISAVAHTKVWVIQLHFPGVWRWGIAYCLQDDWCITMCLAQYFSIISDDEYVSISLIQPTLYLSVIKWRGSLPFWGWLSAVIGRGGGFFQTHREPWAPEPTSRSETEARKQRLQSLDKEDQFLLQQLLMSNTEVYQDALRCSITEQEGNIGQQ